MMTCKIHAKLNFNFQWNLSKFSYKKSLVQKIEESPSYICFIL